jgi:hypothetical protein
MRLGRAAAGVSLTIRTKPGLVNGKSQGVAKNSRRGRRPPRAGDFRRLARSRRAEKPLALRRVIR